MSLYYLADINHVRAIPSQYNLTGQKEIRSIKRTQCVGPKSILTFFLPIIIVSALHFV